MPLLAIVTVCALVAAGLYAASRTGRSSAETGALSFVLSDGAVTCTRGDTSTSGVMITESARYTGAAVLASVDWTLVTPVLGAIDARFAGHHFLRRISTDRGEAV